MQWGVEMSLKKSLLATTSLIMVIAVEPQVASAATIVANIFGVYDAECGTNTDCTLGTGDTAVHIFTGNPETSLGFATGYDTPSLFINNPTSHPFTGGTLKLTGYQGIENGLTSQITVPTIAAGTILQIIWTGTTSASQAPGDLFSFDYDDLFGASSSEDPGNFDAVFQATWNSETITSCFSPNNTQGCGNIAGDFVGWEGLNPPGFAESVYDNHSGSVEGPLANIFTGTTGSQVVPEPGTLALFGAGLGVLGLARRKRKSTKPAL
jgi:hypothetical protein